MCGSGILRGTNRIAAIRIVPIRALQDSAYKSPDILSELLPYWDKVRQNKYDLAHQFANVIKHVFVYIKNKTGEKAKLKFGTKHLAVRFVLFQYVSCRGSTFRIVTVRSFHLNCHLCCQREQERGRFLKVKISKDNNPPWVNNDTRCLMIDDLVFSEQCRVRHVVTPSIVPLRERFPIRNT